MFSHYLTDIEGIATYPIVSLLLFVPFFIGVVVFAFRMNKEHVDKMSRLPLDQQQEP